MNIKVFTHKLKIEYRDDFEKATEFLTRKIKQTGKKDITFNFTFEETAYNFKDAPAKLLQPLDGKYDVVMYMFERADGVPNSLCWWMGKSAGISVSTATYDDAVGGTWMTIVHEMIHGFFYKLASVGVQVFDPMDAMYVKGVLTPYYKNWEPEAVDGNFATAFGYLGNFWDKIDPKPVQLDSCLPGELYDRHTGKKCPLEAPICPVQPSSLSKWGLTPTLEKKAAQFLIDAKNAGYSLKITQGLRDPAYQDKLYAQGRTLPGKIVTNATGKNSKHCLGKAFDFAYNGKTPYPSNGKWKEIGAIGKKLGLVWGGDFKSFVDRLHFEI